jgi:hypothetical protein
VLHKTLVALAAAVGCVPAAMNALAASHPSNHANARHAATGHATGRHSMAGYVLAVMLPDTGAATAMERSTMDRSIYDSYGDGACPGYGGVVGGLIGGVLGGYRPF